MTVRAEGRWTGIAQLGHSQHHIGTSAAQSVTPEPENLSRASIRTLPTSSARSEYQNRNQKQCCSFQQLQPQSTALKEKDAQARCEDPTPTKNMPISGKSAIVRAYNWAVWPGASRLPYSYQQLLSQVQAYNARYLNERVWVHVDGGRLMKQHSSKVGMNLNI